MAQSQHFIQQRERSLRYEPVGQELRPRLGDVDQLLADAIATGDDAKRAELYNKAQRQIVADVAGLPSFHKKLVLAAKSSVDMDSMHTNAEGYPNFYDVGFLA